MIVTVTIDRILCINVLSYVMICIYMQDKTIDRKTGVLRQGGRQAETSDFEGRGDELYRAASRGHAQSPY